MEEPSFNNFTEVTLVKAGNRWYGFICSLNGNSLYRADFGESLLNKFPTVTNLGNVGGNLSQPQDIEIVEEAGFYYGFINNRGSNKLIRINFGNSIENTAVTSDILLTERGSGGAGLDIAFDGNSWVVAVTDTSNLTLVNLPGSAGSKLIEVINSSVISDFSGAGDIEFAQEGTMWFGFLTSANSKAIYRLSFGESLFVNPTAQKLSITGIGALEASGLFVAKEQGEWLLISTTRQGNLLMVNLGPDIASNNHDFTDLGNFGVLTNNLKLDVKRFKSRWIGVTADWNSKRFYLIEFPQADCAFDKTFSRSDTVVRLRAQQSGTHHITLTGRTRSGKLGSISKMIKVSEKQAPQMEVSSIHCASSPAVVTTENLTPDQTITSYTWTLPDGSQQHTAEASYQFTEPGKYKVRLDVESDNSCGNFFEKEIAVYPEPQAAYELSETMVCSNAVINFSNITAYEADSVISYSWDFGDGKASAELSPQHQFEEAGTYTVTLSASIPGCTSTSTQTIEVQQGPKTLFAAANVCTGTAVAFDNQTTGQNISGYHWDLGDGTYSTLENPEHVYDAPGTYLAMLQAENALGCETSFTQSVRVYSLPEPGFSSSPACEGNLVQFTDATLDADGNIIGWGWAFEMPDGTTLTRNVQNPAVTYSQAGSFEVSLTTTTTWGCSQTIKETVVVAPMPEPVIGFAGACAGSSAVVADMTNTGSLAVQSWYWKVGNEVFTDSAFNFHFAEAGTYEVFLQLNLNNGCSVQGTRQIVIEPLPAVDFAFSGACVGQLARLEALTPAAEYRWTIEGESIAAKGPVVEHVFLKEGAYEATLRVFDEQGCSNTLSKEILVGQPPVAAFSADRLRGVAPFNVHFRNQSEGAVASRWLFGDQQQSSSSLANPAFTFTEVGDYVVQLVAYNEAGCADTTSQKLSVLNPSYDVALSSLHQISDNGRMQLVLGLENKGTIGVSDMELEVILNNEFTLREQFIDTLEIGEQRNYALHMQLDEKGGRN